MKHSALPPVAALAAVLSACASAPALPSGMQAGSFARLACEGGKTFAVRVAEDGKSARVRALHGSAELSAKGAGVFEGEGYKLMLEPPGGAALTHEGKDQGKGCKVQA